MTSTASSGPSAAAVLPLFYRALEPLSSVRHADWRLKGGDAGFAADTPYVPLVVGELAAAARDYPIVFAANGAQPVAVLGLERRNLFVEAGRWTADAYVPAYVRRYPFGFLATADGEQYALAIDSGPDQVSRGGDEGAALFEAGKPSALTSQALAFCNSFESDARSTREFADALIAQDLLVDRRADATLPDGRRLGLDGFRIVSPEKFAALPDAVVLDWHRRGWLALIHFHLASLDRFSLLLSRQTGVAAEASDPVPPAPVEAAGVADQEAGAGH